VPARPAAKTKSGKRYRPPGPPFYDKLYGGGGRHLAVTLEAPSEGDMCPLTLSPIADDCLDFLSEGATWFASFPTVKKMVLPCGHSFGALSLLYHFARRNMRCPCCRAGLDSQVQIGSVPAHLRLTFSSKVDEERAREDEEQEEADARVAASLSGAYAQDEDDRLLFQRFEASPDAEPGITLLFSIEPADYASAGVSVRVDFYARDADRAAASISVPLLPNWQTMRSLFDYELQGRDGRPGPWIGRGRNRGQTARLAPQIRQPQQIRQPPQINSPRPGAYRGGNSTFAVPSGHIRSLIEDLMSDGHVHSFAVSTYFSGADRGGPPARVAQTGRIEIDRQQNRTVRDLPVGNGSHFHIETHAGDRHLEDLAWVAPGDFFDMYREV
jgi:hypothetical protein